MFSVIFSDYQDLTSCGAQFRFFIRFSFILYVIVSLVFLNIFEYVPPSVLIIGSFIACFFPTFGRIINYFNRYNNFYRECVNNNIEDPTSSKNRKKMEEIADKNLMFIGENLEDAYLIGKGVKSKGSNTGVVFDYIKEKKTTILFIIFAFIIAFFMAQRDTTPKWSDLSEQEKANAEFAYEVKQYQKEYEKNHKKK